MPIGSVRRGQLITTYGVGAMVPASEAPVMIAGIDSWPTNADDEIHEPRLEVKLSKTRFYMPRATGRAKRNDIPAVRFPEWYYCQSCHRLDRFDALSSANGSKCNRCNDLLVPSRFVVMCEDGHIDDFPYFEWVHGGRDVDSRIPHRLSIKAGGISTALKDVIVECSCGLQRSMEGSFSYKAVKEVLSFCSGRRPWLSDKEKCKKIPRTSQRGASNVYFPIVESAISIPPWSEGAYKAINRYWEALRNVPENVLDVTIDGMGIAEHSGYSVADLVEVVLERKAGSGGGQTISTESLKAAEYQALNRGRQEMSEDQDFVCVGTDPLPRPVSDYIRAVMVVKRLREVQVLRAFTRLEAPSSAEPDREARLSRNPVSWLPAVEVNGEGVFFILDSEKLYEWERRGDARDRASRINSNYEKRFRANKSTPDRIVTARMIMLHSLSHALILQWALESGYPAASLRERIYASETMAGILVYTASTDSAGSLGGLVAMAESDNLRNSVAEAVTRTAWCSYDPLCIEAQATGVDSLNLAACHACMLLPEVSCEEQNVMLDRAMLIGTPECPGLGFLSSLVE